MFTNQMYHLYIKKANLLSKLHIDTHSFNKNQFPYYQIDDFLSCSLLMFCNTKLQPFFLKKCIKRNVISSRGYC